ncbi:hypothetical protein ALPO108162_00670 [Alicyclobacillus pomorum]|nr:hypothetical protein [Alicyclobacillus pomorum]
MTTNCVLVLRFVEPNWQELCTSVFCLHSSDSEYDRHTLQARVRVPWLPRCTLMDTDSMILEEL